MKSEPEHDKLAAVSYDFYGVHVVIGCRVIATWDTKDPYGLQNAQNLADHINRSHFERLAEVEKIVDERWFKYFEMRNR